MNNEDAKSFAFNSFVTAFQPGNEKMLDQYFDTNVVGFNYSKSKQFDLPLLKSILPELHRNYKDLKSEIKNVIKEDHNIAFHVKQKAYYVPNNKHIFIDVMNIYKLVNGKVREWQIWDNHPSKQDK